MACLDIEVSIGFLPKIETEYTITNLAFSSLMVTSYKKQQEKYVLYLTTMSGFYFFSVESKRTEVYILSDSIGAVTNCFAIHNEKAALCSSYEAFVIEYINLEKGPLIVLEGKKQVNNYINYISVTAVLQKLLYIGQLRR